MAPAPEIETEEEAAQREAEHEQRMAEYKAEQERKEEERKAEFERQQRDFEAEQSRRDEQRKATRCHLRAHHRRGSRILQPRADARLPSIAHPPGLQLP